MSLHIGASSGEIAETVLISGDPLRARHIAESMLVNAQCYSHVRGMLGFTGTYNGKRVSVQGTGMGIPSTAIYVTELIREYGVKRLIRIGTCGAIQPDLELGQLILVESAFTDSCAFGMKHRAEPPAASRDLLQRAQKTAADAGVSVLTGQIFSTDLFYSGDESGRWTEWTNRGVLAVEMESSVLFTLAAAHDVEALTILTVSDNILRQEYFSADQRERVSHTMMQIALQIA